MSNQQLISKGRDEIREIDNALGRAARIAEDTEAVGRAVSTCRVVQWLQHLSMYMYTGCPPVATQV
jgi:hypothetical protein